ncbi:hypothetical protein SDC9_04516 [bioreactor metagenome]|jgi:hypothetical protein|uniref:Uncharacterized protein n=1 Tax=bioreactor metagenome TaxID=1076179 RepID=A0A644SW77_9ZZZZ
MSKGSKFSPEVRERTVRPVIEQTKESGTQWAIISSIGPKIGCTQKRCGVGFVNLNEIKGADKV